MQIMTVFYPFLFAGITVIRLVIYFWPNLRIYYFRIDIQVRLGFTARISPYYLAYHMLHILWTICSICYEHSLKTSRIHVRKTFWESGWIFSIIFHIQQRIVGFVTCWIEWIGNFLDQLSFLIRTRVWIQMGIKYVLSWGFYSFLQIIQTCSEIRISWSEMTLCPISMCDRPNCMHCQYNLVTGQQANIVTFKDMEQFLIEEITRKHL